MQTAIHKHTHTHTLLTAEEKATISGPIVLITFLISCYCSVCVCVFSLTVCNLQQGLGDDAAGDVECLTAVVSSISTLYVCDGEIASLRDRKTAGGLRGLVGEQKVLPVQEQGG